MVSKKQKSPFNSPYRVLVTCAIKARHVQYLLNHSMYFYVVMMYFLQDFVFLITRNM